MRDDAVHFEFLFIRVGLGDVKLPHNSCPVALTTAAAEATERNDEGLRKKAIDKSRISIQQQGTMILCNAYLPSKTMGSSHHPGAVHQHPSAHQASIQLQVDQPGPAARRSRGAAHNSGARLRDVLYCGRPLTTDCCLDRETCMVKKCKK